MKPYTEVIGQYANHNNMLLPSQAQPVEPDYISLEGLERARFNSAWWTRAKHPFIGATKAVLTHVPQFLGNTTDYLARMALTSEAQQAVPMFGQIGSMYYPQMGYFPRSKEQVQRDLDIAKEVYGDFMNLPDDAEQYQKDFAEMNKRTADAISQSLRALTDKNRDWVERMFPTPPDNVDRFLQDVGGGVVSFGEAIALQAFSGGTSVFLYFGLTEAGQKFREMDEAGVSVNKAILAATLSGFNEGALESVSTLLAWNSTLPWLARGGMNAILEGTEEVLQSASSDTISYVFGSREWEGKASAKQMIGSALYAGAIGTIIGWPGGFSLALGQRNRVQTVLESGGMSKKQAELKANELMAKTATHSLEEMEKNLWGQMVKEQAVIMDAVTGKMLNADSQQILNDVYQRYVDEGLIKQDPNVDPSPAVKASAIDMAKQNMMDNSPTQDSDIVDITEILSKEQDIRKSILLRDGNEKAIRKIEDLANKLGVRIGRIRYEDTQHFMDWNNPEDQIVLRQHGETEESYNERIRTGRQLFKAGIHTTYTGRDGQQWSEIRLFRGFDATDIYHEFAHAVEEQGGIPNWAGTKEEHAHYIEKVIAEGREQALAEFTEEGRRIDDSAKEVKSVKDEMLLLENKSAEEVRAIVEERTVREESKELASIRMIPTELLRDKSLITEEFGVGIRTRENIVKYRTPEKYNEYKVLPTWDSFKKSIKTEGIKNPIEIYVEKNGKLTIVEGTHRLLASEEIGIENVPAVIRGYVDKAPKQLLDILNNRQFSVRENREEIPKFKSTEEAQAFGKIASMAQLIEMQRRRDEILARNKELLADPDITDEQMNQGMIDAVEAQLYRESIEASPTHASLRERKPMTRQARYEDIQRRIEDIGQQQAYNKEKINALKNILTEVGLEIQPFVKNIAPPTDEQFQDEYKSLPVRFKNSKGGDVVFDQAVKDAGFGLDADAFLNYIADLQTTETQVKEEIASLREKEMREINKRSVKSELDYLNQRLSDYKQGKFQGRKELQAIKEHLGQIARKVLPTSVRWKALSLVQNVNEKNFAEYMNRIANIYKDYETWLTRGKAIKRLLKQYKHPENVVDVRYQEMIDKIRERLGETKADRRKTLRDMNTEELVNLARKVAFLEEKGKMSYKQREENRAMAREIMRASLIRAAGGEIDPGVIGSYEEKKAKGKGTTAFRRGNIRPIYLFEKIFGQHGKDMLYSSIDWSETIKGAGVFDRITKIKKAFRDYVAVKDNKLGDAIGQHNLGKTVTIDGVTFQINEIFALYAQRNNEHARKAITGGNRLSEDIYNKFTSYLEKEHPDYVKFVNAVKEIVGDRYEEARQVMADTFNVVMPKEKDYFPMFRVRFDAVADPEAKFALDLIADADIKTRGGVDYAGVEKGFTIARQDIEERNQQPISLDFMGDALRAIETQEHFINFAKIQKMINGIKGDPALRNSVTYNHGAQAWEALDAYLNNAINPRMNKVSLDVVSKWARKVRKAMGVSYLGFNIVTALKQFPSAHFALPWTNPAQLYTSMARVVGSAMSDGALIEQIYELDPSIRNRVVNRDINEFQKNYPKLAKNDVIRGLQIAHDQLGKNAFSLIMMMDKWAVLSVYDSVYQTQRKTLGDAEARKIAHEVVIKTQPQGRMIDLPELYRTNNEFLRMALMFTNQLNQIYNMMREGLPSDITNQQYGQAVSRIASIMVSSLLIYLASHGGKFPDEDDDERVLQWIDAIAGSSIASLPIVGNLIMSKARGYSTALNPTVSVIDSLEWSLKKMGNDKVLEGATEALINASILAGAGIPYSQPRRTIKGALDIIDSETDDWRRLIWSKSALQED